MKTLKIISAPRRKLTGILIPTAAALCIVLLAGVLGRSCGGDPPNGKTEEERLAYIRSLGWEAKTVPAEEKQILLPEDFPEVLLTYNESQREAGFDLTRYAGKVVTMYTYELTNYPAQGEVLCTLYVYRGRIIGGDIHSTSFTGFLKPLHTAEDVK